MGVVILCALSTVGGAMLVPSGQPGEQDLFGLPSIRHYLPGVITQHLSQPAPAVQAPAVPAPGIVVSPARANRGGAVTVTGTRFNASQKFTVDLTQGGANYKLQPASQVPANGTFLVSAIIPGQATPGAATIRACSVTSAGAAGACAQQQITVV